MAAAKGNQYAKGKGRKTAAQEKADYQWLLNAFYGEASIPKLQAKIASGTFSPADRFICDLLMDGGEKTRMFVAGRLFPERQPVDEKGSTEQKVVGYIYGSEMPKP